MAIITISRLTGSGGREIATAAAQALNFQLIDRDGMDLVIDQQFPVRTEQLSKLKKDRRVFDEMMKSAIAEVAAAHNVVVLGSGAQFLFARVAAALHVQIVAPLPYRIARVMRLAQTHPELFGTRIKGVALFSTSAGEMADYSPIKGLRGRTFARIAEPLMATLNRVPELVDKSRRAGSDLGYVVTRRMAFGSPAPASYVEFVSEMLAETSLDVVADFYPSFAELDEYAALEIMSAIETAVVGGEEDMITPIEHTARIMELLPAAGATRVPDCGHLGMIEHHKIFNDVLDDLVARVRARMA